MDSQSSTRPATATLAGAWKLVSDTHVGLALFTERHFNMMVTRKDRRSYGTDELSDAEAAEAFRSMEAAGGTYEVSGTHIVFHRLVNRHPNWTGKDYSWDFSLSGDELTLKDYRWRRVS